MPTISTQTIDCVDVIDQLNQEFFEIQKELLDTQKQLKEEKLECTREYHMGRRAGWEENFDGIDLRNTMHSCPGWVLLPWDILYDIEGGQWNLCPISDDV